MLWTGATWHIFLDETRTLPETETVLKSLMTPPTRVCE
jgi:hypothetical protein